MSILRERKEVVALHDPTTGQPIEFDEKPYLLLMVPAGSDDFESGEFYALRGRKNVYEWLVSQYPNFDILHSYVMSGNIKFGEEVSIYSFMRMLLEKRFGEENLTMEELIDFVLDQNPDMDESKLQALYLNEMNQLVSK